MTECWQEAIDLLHESMAIGQEINYRRGVALSLEYLGMAATGLCNFAQAQAYFVEALHVASELGEVPLALSILTHTAELLLVLEQEERALELLNFVLDHSAAHERTRQQISATVNNLYSRLPADITAVAQARGAQYSLADASLILLEALPV
jgi:hypothetical protein